MHDAPQDVLVDAYPEEEYWQDLLKVTGGLTDERSRASRSAPRRLPRLDAPPRRAFPAAALGRAARRPHQRLLPRRRQGAGQRLLPQRRGARRRASATTRRSTASSSTAPASSPPASAKRTDRGARLRARRRRLRVEPRLAERGLGHERARRAAGRELPDPRHALQHRRRCSSSCSMPAPTASATRPRRTWWRSTPARRSTTAASAPASTASRSASSSTATASASTTRARTSGRSATRSGAGWSRASRDRSPGRSSMPRRSAGSCRRSSPARARRRCRSWRRALGLPEAAFVATLERYNAACRGGTFDHTALDDCADRGPVARQDPLGAADRHAALLRLCAAPRRDLHLPRPEGRRARGRALRRARRARTCSWPAR